MERRIGERNILDRFVEDFIPIIDKYCKYIIVSGYVAIASGRSRATEDIDMIMEKVPFSIFENIFTELDEKGFECIQSSKVEDVFEYLSKGSSIRYVRKNNYLLPPEMEIKFPKDELDELQLETRKKLSFTGLENVWFSSVEMNIAFKEELLKSDKDMEDAKHLRLIYRDELSEKLINQVKSKIRKLRLGK